MSTKNIYRLLLLVLTAVPSIAGEETGTADPVLHYYWLKAQQASSNSNPQMSELSYSCKATSFLYRIDSDGHIVTGDSLRARYFFSGRLLDSQRVFSGKASKFPDLDFFYPDIFEGRYEMNLFPNDTGGSDLAIGLVSDSSAAGQPDGLLIIDKEQFLPRALYLYYPDRPGFKRFTRSFKFVVIDGYLFADSIVEVASRHGILTTEHYRLETAVADITITSAEQPENNHNPRVNGTSGE